MDNVTFNSLIDKVKTSGYNQIVNPWESKSIRKRSVDVSTLRHKYTLTEEALAEILGVNADEIKEWEEGDGTPKGAAAILLRIAEKYPSVFLDTLWNY